MFFKVNKFINNCWSQLLIALLFNYKCFFYIDDVFYSWFSDLDTWCPITVVTLILGADSLDRLPWNLTVELEELIGDSRQHLDLTEPTWERPEQENCQRTSLEPEMGQMWKKKNPGTLEGSAGLNWCSALTCHKRENWSNTSIKLWRKKWEQFGGLKISPLTTLRCPSVQK